LTALHEDEEEKKNLFEKKKYKIADSKKLSFSITPILNIFFQKFHGLRIGGIEKLSFFESPTLDFLLHPH
jgi:hypothetical protein